MYHTEVKVVTLPVHRWLEQYCRPEIFSESCRACPNYGRVWSCPPLPQSAAELIKPFSCVHIIGVKVIYDRQLRQQAIGSGCADEIRAQTYGKVKRALLESLLALETVIPGSWSIAAGECEQCKTCCRSRGVPCCKPERMRYSFSGLGFDLTRIARELLEMELLWQKDGLPEYHVAIAALLERQGSRFERSFRVDLRMPWELFQRECLGVLQQLGCEIQNHGTNGEGVSLIDRSTGDGYF